MTKFVWVQKVKASAFETPQYEADLKVDCLGDRRGKAVTLKV